MKRPKTNSKKISWFSIASVFLLAVALAVGASTNAQAATGSFDRDKYLPALSSTNDYDRAFISVTDSSVTTATTDTITISIKAGANAIDFILRETGATTTVFTTTGLTQPGQIGVGTTSGYAPDFRGSHLYPALGVSTQSDTPGVTAVNLKGFVTQNGGNATDGTNGNLTVASGNTLELLYGGSTLDTAVVGFSGDNNSSITFTKGSAWGESVTGPADAASVADNIIITLNEPDENLNPKMKDCIGFQDGFRAGLTGTGSSKVQIEAINQSTGTRLSVGGTPVVARHIMLTETGNSTGIFTAAGKVYGSTTAGILRGNIFIAGTSNASFMGGETQLSDGSFPYTGGFITLGSTTTNALGVSASTSDNAAVGFKILEITASGRIGLIYAGTATSGIGTTTLAYQASTGAFTAASSAFGTSSWSGTRVVAIGTNSTAYGAPGISGNTGSGTSNLLKLIDGNNYCLVQVGTYTVLPAGVPASPTGTTNNPMAIGATFEGGNNGLGAGSITVTIGSFILTGPRGGDTVKVSYLDALTSVGTIGTVTSSTTFGTTGETGTVAADKTSVDINDFLTITVVDGNLNASSSSQTSIASGNWDGTTTNSRGDRLTVAGYTQSKREIDLSHADGSRVGTQSIRISNSDNSLVWIVPNSQIDAEAVTGFRNPLEPGSSTFRLGTETTSALPAIALTRGAAADATSFLSGAGTGSFVATADAVNGTVEISPDGTHWIAVPITETGINSSTFVGTVGFDFSAARVTIDTTTANSTSIFTDHTGTSSIIFVDPMTANFLERTMGTGSVVRISDGLFSEFQEVTGVAGLTLSVKKMTNTSLLTPWKTFVQVVGNDMSQDREDTTSSGSKLFRIGGYFGATYRIRYNDAVNSSGSYAGGATLAATTANVVFTTSTGELSTAPSGTTGVNSMIVVTLVDNDLNTNAAGVQTTFAVGGTTLPINLNEVGLGVPSGTSTGNSGAGSSALAKKNGGAAKVIFASNKSSVTSSNITDASTSNSAHFALTETAANSGTFKGSFQLSSTDATSQSTTPPRLKVTSGDVVTVFYNDSPSASVENNLKSLTAASFVVQSGIGSLSLSKSEAFLNGDSVVVTVSDSDLNTSTTTSESTQAFVTSSSATGSITVALAESTASSGLYVGTFRTGATTDTTTTPRTIRAVAGGTLTVTYQDASPAQDVTALVSTKNFGAALDITSNTVPLDGNAIVSLRDEETNTSIATANIASLNIKSTTDSTGVAVIVTETGVATGSFLGTIKVSTGSSLSNTNIKAAVGDTLTVTFTDNPNASGLSSVVTDTALVTSAAATPTPTPTATPTPTPTPTPAPGTGSITGTVVNIALAAPISGATVSTNTGGFTATTAANGTYTISNVTPGTYTLTASATGFASSSQSVTVTAGVTTTANFGLSAAATPTPTATATPTPKPTATATPTPVPCKPKDISAVPPKLTLLMNKSGDVTVTVTGEKDCASEGETVTATTNAAGEKRVSIKPASKATDKNGKVVFTITAKDKPGNARITFTAGDAKPTKITVKVKKK